MAEHAFFSGNSDFQKLEREIQRSPHGEAKQYIVRAERDGFTYVEDVWADSVEIVDGELRFYRIVTRLIPPSRSRLFARDKIAESIQGRELIAAYSRASWDNFGMADDPSDDPNKTYGVIDPRMVGNEDEDN